MRSACPTLNRSPLRAHGSNVPNAAHGRSKRNLSSILNPWRYSGARYRKTVRDVAD